MVYGPRKITLFVGGPNDTGEESKIIAQAARVLAAHYKRTGELDIEVYRWNGEDNPTSYDARENGQDRIDERLPAHKADILIVVFKDRLGTPAHRNGRDYASYSAYELETALEATGADRPRIAVLKFNLREEIANRDYANKTRGLEGEALIEEHAKFKRTEQEHESLNKYLRESSAKFKFNVMPYEESKAFEGLVTDFLVNKLQEISREPRPIDEVTKPEPRPDETKFRGYPFRGMQSLGYDDHDLFHGREARVAVLIDRLRDQHVRFLCLAGPSGAGKSSLMKAGLIGTLIERQRLDGNGAFWLIDMKPGQDPFMTLEKAIEDITRCTGGKRERNNPVVADGLGRLLAKDCRESHRDVLQVLERHVICHLRSTTGTAENREPDIFLVIDQLEELWTKSEDGGAQRAAFLRLLAAAVKSSCIRVLVTLRSDMIPSFEEAKLIAEILSGGTSATEHITPPLIPSELAPMIRETAKAGGIELEERLIGALLTDAEGVGPSALPLVAFTLSELVQRADGKPVTFDAYHAIGRLPGAIENTVRRAIEVHLPGGSGTEEQLAKLFTRLVGVRDVGPEPATVRQVRRKDELVQRGVPASLIDALIEARVLHVGHQGDDLVSLAHDALFQIWQPLKDWVAGNREDLAFRAILVRDATEWKRHGQKWQRFIKLGREALQEAQTRVAERPDLFADADLVHEYLQAAARREDKIRFIQAINASSLAEALDAWERHKGDLGLNRYEDRGTDAGQLRPGIYAAVTGDDSLDDLPSQQIEAEQPASPMSDTDTDTAEQFVGGARQAQKRSDAEHRSIFGEREHREVTVTRGRDPLHLAAMFGHISLVRRLINLGVSPRKKTSGGHVLLGDAAFGGSLEVVRYLVDEVGLKARERDANGSEPLIWACQRGHEAVVDYLLSRGASFTMKVRGGWTCLTEAATGGHLGLVRRLVEREGFDPGQRVGVDQMTPLHYAALGSNERHSDVVRYLCDSGKVNPTAKNAYGQNALHLAATSTSPQMIAFLIGLGLDINFADLNGWTPLHFAVERGDLSVIKVFLTTEKIYLNICNKAGETPLACAARLGHDRVVRTLVAQGADATKVEGTGWTALHYAVDDGDFAVIDALCEPKNKRILNARISPGWTALMLAAQRGRIEAIDRLLREGASLQLRTEQGSSALHLAVSNRQSKSVQTLLDAKHHGYDLRSFVDAPDASGLTALSAAATRGEFEICQMLLKAGADPEGRPKGDFQLPELAARNDINGCVDQLKVCINPNARDAKGRTALSLAASIGSEELCRELLKDARVRVDAREWRKPVLAEDDDSPERQVNPSNAAGKERFHD